MVLDIILLLLFLTFILSGWRKGLLLSLCGLLVFVFSCLGAVVAQQVFTDPLSEWMQPRIESAVQERIQDELAAEVEAMMEKAGETGFSVGGERVELSGLLEILNRFGFDVQQQVQDSVENGTEPVVTAVSRSLSEYLTQKMAPALVFAMAFIVIYLIMQIVLLALNLVSRVPGIGTLDHLGGAVIGGVNGIVLMTAITAVLTISGLLDSMKLEGPISTLVRQIVEMFVH